MEDRELLAEIEDVLRTMPPRETLRHQNDENFAWLGRVAAVIEAWDPAKSEYLNGAMEKLRDVYAQPAAQGFAQVMMLLHQARNALRMKTVGPVNVVAGAGSVFDYFDEIRKIIESSSTDILFVDPYLDAEFVSKYLVHIHEGVRIRLLGREKLKTLLPAVDAFIQQHKRDVSVRSSPSFHDRYVIVDGAECYQSGASFKDGAKKSPTTLTQITDAFPAIKETYEQLWDSANVER